MNRTKILIVDDSQVFGQFLTKALSTDPDLDVVGHALDAYEARVMIKELQPDVLTLDVEMPKMNGITFLRNLMRLHPMPVVMLSSLTTDGAQETLDALEAGAVDFMVKRHPASREELKAYVMDMVQRVKDAAGTPVAGRAELAHTSGTGSALRLPDLSICAQRLKKGTRLNEGLKRVIAIGASTGGPEALRTMLTELRAPACALLISQHMPERFMVPFAERLNGTSQFQIKIAEHNEHILPGYGYVAPGDTHMAVVRTRDGNGLTLRLSNSALVCGHRPSVDVLFDSVAAAAPSSCLGVLMTGMGDDGARGLKAMHDAGSATIIQDRQSSTVWGMPGRAHEYGAVDGVLSLSQMAPALNTLLDKVR